MGFAEKIERLARIIPGIGGYQDRETSRDTDKSVRLKLSAEVEELKLEIEKEKRICMDKDNLSLLPALDSLASKLDKTANLIKYAERGYSGIFDIHKVGQDNLDRLCSFDLALFDEIETLKTVLRGLHDASSEPSAAREQISKLDEAIEAFGKKFSTRRDLLISR
jgi:hypothetical protein